MKTPADCGSLTALFQERCARRPDKVALADKGGALTYGQCAALAAAVAGAVAQAAARERVGILLPACKEFGPCFFGVLRAGRVPTPLNCLLGGAELSYIVRDAGIDTILACAPLAKAASALADRTLLVEEVAHTEAPAPSVAPPEPDDLAALIYTSGTVANPKGVMLSHRNLLSNVQGCMDAISFTEDDVILGPLPLFHSFALTTSLLLPIALGATAVYLPRFSATRMLDLLARQKVTTVMAIPSMYRVLLTVQDVAAYDLSALRLCVAGGESLPKEVVRAFDARFPVPLLEGYGVTETAPVLSVNRPGANKPGTAGQPLPNVEIRIAAEDGTPLPAGSEGEVWARGDNVMLGYHGLPEETRAVLTEDGWFRTGDLGVMDDDGYLAIKGRIKELIISSGENISPAEIEDVLSRHPAVFEVAAVPMPDPVRGEVSRAFLALHEGRQVSATELRAFCQGQLARHKIPRAFEFRDSLPHGPTGKILKRALR